MALTTEEVKIRMGMDSTALRAGMESSSRFVESSLKAVSNKAVSLLKANLYLAVLNLFRELLPTAEEFWNSVYGVDEKSMAGVQVALDNIKKIRAGLGEAQNDLKKEIREMQMLLATKPEKAAILAQDVEDARVAVSKTVTELKQMETVLSEIKKSGLRSELEPQQIIGIAAAKTQLAKQTAEMVKAEREFYKAQMDALNSLPAPQPNFSKQPLMNTMLPIAQLPFMGGLKGAIDKTNLGIALFEAMHRQPVKVIIKGVDE